MVNYFCWNQMSKIFMQASHQFLHRFDKKMLHAANYGNYRASLQMDDATMMYTMGGEMQ